ncbi:hypothetical protein Pcinc_010544 [Petrolisthes cinctipes]|uniref:Uncharacterized protein n=1 Tax=Petrolisthes cinctipes TaxID=88211 RepID=A0AAE1G4L2_PETCI|nr:hypothetical protein Pcinc_010544 [Petrolisthes cinctipes]
MSVKARTGCLVLDLLKKTTREPLTWSEDLLNRFENLCASKRCFKPRAGGGPSSILCSVRPSTSKPPSPHVCLCDRRARSSWNRGIDSRSGDTTKTPTSNNPCTFVTDKLRYVSALYFG